MRRDSNTSVRRITGRIQRLFFPRFYHDRRDTNFLKGLTFVGEKNSITEIGFLMLNSLVQDYMNIGQKRRSTISKFSP